MSRFFRFLAVIVGLGFSIWSSTSLAQSPNLAAFEGFVQAGDYKNADFYLSNGFVSVDEVDTSQLFYTTFTQVYGGDARHNGRAVDRLYNYLAKLGAIDLNREFACGYNLEDTCLLLNRLVFSETKPRELAWFVARGLNLNLRLPEHIPATLPLLIRLASVYSMADLNWFVANGMVIGDEAYTLDDLVGYTDDYLKYYNQYYRLEMPENYLNLGDQNLLDVLVMVLGTRTQLNDKSESRRRTTMCEFITHAASGYVPSFDYLFYLLDVVPEFRGDKVGRQTHDNKGVYQEFPSSCVSLIQAMAANHARIDEVISRFVVAGDVPTAQWLISIRDRQ